MQQRLEETQKRGIRQEKLLFYILFKQNDFL